MLHMYQFEVGCFTLMSHRAHFNVILCSGCIHTTRWVSCSSL